MQNQKLRIFFVTGWFYSSQKGSGAAKFIAELERGLQVKGHTVTVVRPSLRNVSNYYLATMARLFLNFGLFFKDFSSYDAVLCFDYDGFALRHKYSPLTIQCPRAIFADIYKTESGMMRIFAWIQAFFEKHGAQHADQVVVPSRYAKAMVASLYGVPRDQISVIYNGIAHGPVLQPVVPPNNVLRLLAVGKMYPRKNIPLLIQVVDKLAEKIPNLRLDVLGDGIDFEQVRKIHRSLQHPEKIFLHGFVSDTKMLSELYARCDYLCHLSSQETFGNVVLEAMSYGKPVIALNKASMPELITHGVDGFLLRGKDADSLAEEIRHHLQSVEYDKTSQAAQKKASQMTQQRTILAFEQFLFDQLGSEN